MRARWAPPPYPYDRLDALKPLAQSHDGGMVDLSVGTPGDPAPDIVRKALAASGREHGYPWSVGSTRLREAAAAWLGRRFGVDVAPEDVAACVGAKELVATLAQWLRLRSPDRDTVLYPAVSYPTYAMGATLAGCRAVPFGDLSSVTDADAARALCLWVNSPANPTGQLTDLGAAARWGRARYVPVFSDECYAEFTWEGPPRSILEHGSDGVVAVHSLSKRSNMAGLRSGFYAGDPDLVHYLAEVRKHVGLMTPGPVQEAAAAALDDDAHVEQQRARYHERLGFFAEMVLGCEMPAGGFYLWAPAPDGDAWAFTERLARDGGCLVAPGDLYGETDDAHVRVAMVQPLDRLELVAERLSRIA